MESRGALDRDLHRRSDAQSAGQPTQGGWRSPRPKEDCSGGFINRVPSAKTTGQAKLPGPPPHR